VSAPRRPAPARQTGWRYLVRPRAAGQAGPGITIFSYVVTVVIALACSLPLLYILSTSLKDQQLLITYPPNWIPSHLYWGNYTNLLFNTPFLRWVLNTLVVALSVTLIKVIFDSMAGYAFAKMKFPFRNVLFVIVIMTMMIPFSAILIPLYFTIFNFGLLNTYWALILPPLANPIGIFLMRGFIEGLPSDLENAARLDGVSEFGIYLRIILPLVRPGLVVLAVLTFLTQYNSFVWPLVAVNDQSMQLITTGLATQRSVWQVNYGIFSAGAVMALVPIVAFFLLLQKQFIAASLAGALKQ
jgi:ABC-type glycerol-3-phosphate transport system permease component